MRSERDKLLKIIRRYGETSQINIAIEEMSELTKELCKYNRDPIKWKHADHILEELADVLIMCKQIQIIFELSKEELDREIDFKIERTLKRENEQGDYHWSYREETGAEENTDKQIRDNILVSSIKEQG